MEDIDSDHPEFWSSRYISGKTPWDLGDSPPSLERFLKRTRTPGKVLIPGCGSGYEVSAFHRAGFDVTALDFSPAAVERAQGILGELRHAVVLGDFFTHSFQPREFDLIYERAFLCSLPPSRWRAYAERVAGLLRPQGQLVGIFLYGEELDPPPYPLTDVRADQLFGDYFQLSHTEPMADSLPIFQGRERWQEWTRL